VNSAAILSSDDFCRRQAHYFQKWEPSSITPKMILVAAVDFGLASTAEDAGLAASDEAMRLCTDVGIDTAESDLLGLASHIAALADMICWIVRGEYGPWERPPAKGSWNSGAFLSRDGRKLRHLAIVDRWDAWRETELKHSWGVQGETATYGVSMDSIVVVIGSMRKGRWSSPLTVGVRHPVAKTLRFERRDGDSFSGTWDRVAREDDKATREEWLDAMSADGVLAETIHVLEFEPHPRATEVVALAERKLVRISSGDRPEPQLSRCHDRVRPCPFRVACPNWVEPSESLGFSRLPPRP